MKSRISRRRFLSGTAAAVAAPLVIPAHAVGLDANVAPSERIGLGFIGAGQMNSSHMRGFHGYKDVKVVAVCDVNAQKRKVARETVEARYAQDAGQSSYQGCADYNDFRDLIADKNVDAVVVATPDHWHTVPALAALRAGKDVYLEKPMTLTIQEGRVLADEVKRTGRVFQHGTQQRSRSDFNRAMELVRNGRIGKLQRIEAGTAPGLSTGDHPEEPVPEWFDYDLWLGQAPLAPYCSARCQGERVWVHISDYSGGQVTAWGVHHLDVVQWAMDTDMTGPVEVEGTGVFPESGLYDTVLTWQVDLRYANGITVAFADTKKFPHGVKLIGDEGWIFVNRSRMNAEPAGILDSVIGPNEIHLQTSRDHRRDFIDCIKSRRETVCPAEMAHRSTTTCHLTNICLLLGRKVRWDPQKEHFLDDPEADRLLQRSMRPPWRL